MSPGSRSPTPTQQRQDLQDRIKNQDAVAALHIAADKLAAELHKAAVCIEGSDLLVERIGSD